MSQTANRVIKNTGYLYAKMAITMFVSLYTTRLILNSLGASDFGIYNIVGGAISMLGFLNVAMASATQRFMSFAEGEGNKDKQKYIFNVSILLHFIISFIVAIALAVAGWFFFHGILNIPESRIAAAQVVYASLILSTVFTVMSVPYDAVMNAHENMRYYAIVGIIESLLKLSVAFACVYATGDKLIVYGILMACIPFVTLSIMRIYCHRKYEECVIRPRTFFDRKVMKEMTSFAGWNLAGSMGSILGNYGNGIVLNSFFGTLLNAAQGIANQLNGMLLVFSNNMIKALNPVIVKKEGAGDHRRMLEYSYSGCRFSFLLFAFFCLPCFAETPFILKLWLKDYPEWTILFVRWQIVRTLLEQTTVMLGTSLNATGKIKESNISGFFINLAPMVLLSIAFAAGASPAWYYPIVVFDMVVVSSGFRLYYCRKYCGLKLREFFRTVFLPCTFISVLIVAIGALVGSAMEPGYVRLFTVLVVMTLATAVLSLCVLSKAEREIIFGLFAKVKSRFIR